MRVQTIGWALAACIATTACGDGSPSSPDAPGNGEDASPDASDPPGCTARELFGTGLNLIPARLLHVSATAAAGGDGSAANPFRTIEEAADVVQPGDAIRLGPGTHTSGQFLSDLRGSPGAPIWIGGTPGQPRPVIAGGVEALHLSRPAYVIVHDLEITGQTANGINVDDGADVDDPLAAHHVAIANVYVHDIGTGGNNDCIKLSGVNDVHVYHSRIERCGAGGSGVDHVGVHRGLVVQNTFDGVMSTAVQVKGGSTDVVIDANRIRISGGRAINLGGSTSFEFFRPPLSTTAPNAEARRVHATNNLITGLGTTATPFAFVGCVDCLAAHNLVRGQQRWNLRILQETTTSGNFTFEPAANGRVISNSFVFTASTLSTAVNVGADTNAASFSFATNLWYASDAPAMSTPMLPSTETGGVVGMPSGYANLPDDPNVALPGGYAQIVVGSPEWAAQPPRLLEVVATFSGSCRDASTTIGPGEGESPSS